MNKKLKKILLSIFKAFTIILIVGLLSMFLINKQEEKKANNQSLISSETSTLNTESTEISSEENIIEEETIPEYIINERLLEYEDWKYYVKNGKAYIAEYIGKDKTTITIPSKISSYTVAGFTEGVCWYNKELKTVIISEGIKEIPIKAFVGCENLTNIRFPISLTTISSNAFEGCSSLETITINKNVISISDSAFVGLTSLKNIEINPENKNFIFENGTLYNGSKNKILKVITTNDSYDVPVGVREIGSYAFSYNDNLKNITFSATVSTLNEFSFYNCNNIESVYINKGIKEIKPGAFYNCLNLSSFEVDITNQYYFSEDGVLYSRDKTKLIFIPAAYKKAVYFLPQKTIYIESYAFIDCKINTFIIHKDIAKINSYAFIEGKNTELQIELNSSLLSSRTNLDWNKLFKGTISTEE
jgi:hypothetical protein